MEFGVLVCNLFIVFLVPVIFLAVYPYRISVEERMLARVLGEDYVQYQRRTGKLIHYVW